MRVMSVMRSCEMDTRSRYRPRHRNRLASTITLVAILLLVPLASVPPASAAPTCSFVPPTLTVQTLGEAVRLSVGSGGEIVINDDTLCTDGDVVSPQTADTGNTTSVVVTGTASPDHVTIDQAGDGRAFPRGISFSVFLDDDDDGEGDELRLLLTDGEDELMARSGQLFMFGASGGDVQLSGVDVILIEARGGDDEVVAAHLDPDAEPVPPITVWGGGGADALTGGASDDRLYGEVGADLLDGQGGDHDVLIGGPEAGDECVYEDGNYAPCDPAIELQPPSALAGTTITGVLSGWYPENGTIEIAFGALPRVEVEPALDGSGSAPLDVPTGESPTQIVACQQCARDPRNESRATFEYAPPSEITMAITPKRASAGGTVSVSGFGWRTGEVVSIFVDAVTPGEGSVASDTPGEDSVFETSFDVGDLAIGGHRVIACQRCGADGELRRARSLHVVAARGPSTITVEPASGSVGEFFVVRGEGWISDRGPVTLRLDGAPASGTIVAAAELVDGSFEVRFEAPDVAPGTYTLIACQSCDSPRRVEDTALVSIVAATPWWSSRGAKAAAAGVLVLLLAAAALFRWRRIRRQKGDGHPTPDVGARLSGHPIRISITTIDDGTKDHAVRVVPRRDLGVQHIEEEVSLR
jgi:hypothetical protein